MAAAKVQPQGRAKIRGKFRDGLRFAYNPGSGVLVDIASGRTGTLSQGAVVAGPKGRGLKFGATADQGLSFGTGRRILIGGSDQTVLVVASPVSQAQRSVIVNQRTAEDFFGFYFNCDAGLNINAGYFSFGGSGKNGTSSGGYYVPNAVTGKVSAYAISVTSAGGAIAAVDGQPKTATGTGNWAATPTYDEQEFVVGDLGNFAGTGYGASEPIYLILVWNRTFDAATLQSLTANPWQVFESQAPLLMAAASETLPINLLGVPTGQNNVSAAESTSSTQKLLGTFPGDVYLQEPIGNDVILYDPDWAINGRQANNSSTGAVTSVANEVVLQGTSTSQGNTAISGTLFLTQQLLGGTTSQASHSSVGVVDRDLELSSAPSVQTNEAASAAVNTTKTLSFALATQSSTLGTGSITRDVALIGTSTAQSATAPVGFISLARELIGNPTTQGSHSSIAAAGGSGTLNAANDSQFNNSSSVGVSVTKTLSGSADEQQAEVTVGSILVGRSLTGSDSGQSNNSMDVAISSATVHNLQGTITVSTGMCGSSPIAQVQVLSGQSATAVNVAAGVSISSIQVLGVSAAVVQNTSSTGLLNSLVALVATISVQVNSTPTSAIAQTQNLVATATNAGCVVGTGVVGQVRFLTGTPTTQGGTSGVGSVVIGALITVGDVHVTVEFNPYDVQFNSGKYVVTVSNEPFDITVTSRRA